MNKILLRLVLCVSVVCVATAAGFAQGRGRGRGFERRDDVFSSRVRTDRGRSQDWKCSVFVNCHDARDGRVDGRGPRARGVWRNGTFYPVGSNVGYRARRNTNDYWRRRHVPDLRRGNWRYR